MSNQLPKPPSHLSPEAKIIWEKIIAKWALDDGGQVILGAALESFDRMREAQRTIKKDGLTFTDRFGQIKSHPLLLIERDSRNSMARLFRQLSIDLEPLK